MIIYLSEVFDGDCPIAPRRIVFAVFLGEGRHNH
jgi:hypothetical protein